eukprot:6590019-Pyramimonas_sp.AAC.1
MSRADVSNGLSLFRVAHVRQGTPLISKNTMPSCEQQSCGVREARQQKTKPLNNDFPRSALPPPGGAGLPRK